VKRACARGSIRCVPDGVSSTSAGADPPPASPCTRSRRLPPSAGSHSANSTVGAAESPGSADGFGSAMAREMLPGAPAATAGRGSVAVDALADQHDGEREREDASGKDRPGRAEVAVTMAHIPLAGEPDDPTEH